jgi:hypothetical protein
MKTLITIIVISFLAGCSLSSKDKEKEMNLSSLKTELEKDGWFYLETLGAPGEWIAETRLGSPTARTVTAFWTSNGQREQKVYAQTDFLYTVISLQKSNNDVFALVFRRNRPK